MRYRTSLLAFPLLLNLACEAQSPRREVALLTPAGAAGTLEPGGPAPAAPATGGARSAGTLAEDNPMLGGIPLAGTTGGSTPLAPLEAGVPASMEWLPSWATSIQSTEPNNLPPPLANNTLRQFVWPTVSGGQIRIQLSNEKGSGPVEIQKVHIAKAATQNDPANSGGQIDTATDAAFLFSGQPSVSIPAGQTVWSDALDYPLQEIQLTAITMQLGAAVPPEITGHPGARTTSYVSSGDVVAQQAMANAQTRDRWYFINAIEVMAPSDAYAIALLGDSITDGYGVLNRFARWSDFLTLAIQADPMIADTRSVLNFGMGANALTGSSQYQDAGVLRFERDVLPRAKIKWLIVFEGINDINGGALAQPLIDAYTQIIDKAHAQGILVYGSPITPNGPSAVRSAVNEWIRTSGAFDRLIDFEAVIRDPNAPDNIAPMYNNDGLHPSIAGYEAMGNAVPLSLFYETARASN